MKKLYNSLLGLLLVATCLMSVVSGYAQNNLIAKTFGTLSSEYGTTKVSPTTNDNERTVGDRGWNYYDNGSYADAIGLENGGSIYWGVMFPAGSFTGNAVTKVKMYDCIAHTGDIMIYQDGSTAPGTLVYTQAYACTGSENFVEWTLSTPVFINPNQNLWIVMHNNDGQYIASACNDTGDPNGRWISTNGSSWIDVASVNNLYYTWMLRAYIETVTSYSWNFDNGMQGWTTIDADGDGFDWVLGSAAGGVYLIEGHSLTGSGHNASTDLIVSGSYRNTSSSGGEVLTPDNYLVSPPLTLVAGSTFSFWACAQDANYPSEHFGVFVSSNGTSNWTMVNEWTLTAKGNGEMSIGRNGETRDQGNWHQYSVNLSNYAGTVCYLAIRHFDCSDMFLLDIDDVELSINPQSYTITANASPSNGGTVSGGGQYNEGTTCTLTATANSGYEFVHWKKGNNVVSTDATYSFTVNANTAGTYTAYFQQAAPTQYTITTNVTPVGSGTVTGGGSYNYGATCSLTATANNGYTFDNWTKNGNVVSTSPNYSFTVSEDATYVAHFTENTNSYLISVIANPTDGGIITGAGIYTPGITITLTATPNEGYKFVNWTENGVIQWLTDQYEFVVDRDRTIVANFEELPKFMISAIAGAHGTISPQGDIQVVQGTDQTFTMTPEPGGRIIKVQIDGIDIGPVETYTFTNVNRDHTIFVSFSGMGVEETQNLQVTVYPNPAKDIVYVEGEEIETIALFDMLGNHLRSMDCNISKELNVSGLPQGTYVLKLITQDGHVAYHKLVLD